MRSLILFFLFSIPVFGFGQIEEVRRITETLCSPEFHGRGYVNKGDSIAAYFLANEFKKINVEPLGDSYFQNFKLNVNTFPAEMRLEQSSVELTPGKDYVIHPTSKGGEATLVPLIIPSDKVLDVEYLKGSISQILESGEFNSMVFDFTKLSADTIKELRGLTQEIASIVPVVELVDEKFTWSVSQVQSTLVLLQIQKSAYKLSEPLEMNIVSKFIEGYQSQNVMAFIPARKKCSKTVVFTAHYDHLGRMGDNTFFPGANDNASGTAMLLTMARHFKANPSNYNIVFIAFAGEEAGLVGSKYFVEHSPLKLKKIKFLVNLDIMGSGEEGITVVNSTLFEKQYELLKQINTEKNLLAKVKKRGPAANSDHYWFTEKGVPAFFIYTMGPNKHYHDVFDTYEELSFSEYHDITTLLIDFVKRL